MLAALKADGSVVAQTFVYALTDDAACGRRVLAALDGPCNPQRGWWHHTGGNQHGPAPVTGVLHRVFRSFVHGIHSGNIHKVIPEQATEQPRIRVLHPLAISHSSKGNFP